MSFGSVNKDERESSSVTRTLSRVMKRLTRESAEVMNLPLTAWKLSQRDSEKSLIREKLYEESSALKHLLSNRLVWAIHCFVDLSRIVVSNLDKEGGKYLVREKFGSCRR